MAKRIKAMIENRIWIEFSKMALGRKHREGSEGKE